MSVDHALDRLSLGRPANSERGAPAVLVVEPEPLVYELIADVLSSAGYRTIAAACRSDTMRALVCEEPPVAVVICDIGDGLGDGYGPGFVRDIAAIRPSAPIVLMSASIDAELVRTYPEPAAWFGKPFSVRAFARSIDRIARAASGASSRAVGG